MTYYIGLKTSENASESAGVTVGAEAIENPVFLRLQKRRSILVGCTEKEAQGIQSVSGNSVYQLEGREEIPAEIENKSEYVAFYTDEYEYERLRYLSELPADTESDENTNDSGEIPEQQENEHILSLAEVSAELNKVKAEMANLSVISPVNDEATLTFYRTISDSSTNSIAKIRAAAQQYLDDTAAVQSEEVVEND